ncbi:hypothetical protein HQK48_02745 [Bacillus velezensis]|nr:hypothetical protein CU084_07240 [Bacillus velezensis]MBO3650028.1 hypothetical protein [Bacillus amyloliquefaciens]AWD12635.1 hypothetical protein B9C53_03555 [Bacillus velezensis]NMW08201.1 hypothetical protein [Bacillus velezensis]NRQ63394.1 hypothetical protein [Bacillus velezensis]
MGSSGFHGSSGSPGSLGLLGSSGFHGSSGSPGSLGLLGSSGFHGSSGSPGLLGLLGSSWSIQASESCKKIMSSSFVCKRSCDFMTVRRSRSVLLLIDDNSSKEGSPEAPRNI